MLRCIQIGCFVAVWALCACPRPAAEGSEARQSAHSATPREAQQTPKAATSGEHLPWIEDDLSAARETARAQNRPVVVDLWAPWCHTCLSMQKFVLTSPAILRERDRFVWASLDTDKPQNASAVAALPQNFWPTFYLLAPTGEVLARHVGAASESEFLAFLAQGNGSATDAERVTTTNLRQQADAAAAQGNHSAAAGLYRELLQQAGNAWPARFSIRVALLEASYKAARDAECVEDAWRYLEDMSNASSASATDFSYLAQTCSERAKSARHAELLARLSAPEGPIRAMLRQTKALSVDDKSDALRVLRELAEAQNQPKTARDYALEQHQVLETAVAQLSDPSDRMTYHWPRLEVHLWLGKGEELVEELRASALALPGEYDPPYRLAYLLQQLQKYEEALAPARSAVALSYGPRKARAYDLLGNILHALDRHEDEKRVREECLGHIESLPPSSKRDAALEDARQKLAALQAAP